MNMKETLKEHLRIIYKALDDKKAEDIQIIDISEVSTMADYFVIASGNNINQVHALCDNVSEELAKTKVLTKQTEGYTAGNWILMDYGDVIVHVFAKEDRLFYDLERVWRDGTTVSIEEL